MVAYGRQLVYGAAKATLALHDVATQPLPHAAGSVDLVSMSSVLHVFDEPLPALAEIRRALALGGVFLLHELVRPPLSTYPAWGRGGLKEGEAGRRRRGCRPL